MGKQVSASRGPLTRQQYRQCVAEMVRAHSRKAQVSALTSEDFAAARSRIKGRGQRAAFQFLHDELQKAEAEKARRARLVARYSRWVDDGQPVSEILESDHCVGLITVGE